MKAKENIVTGDAAVIWQILESVTDPEIPVLSVIELGIVREVILDASKKVTVYITPTYVGCPVLDIISLHIRQALKEHGFSTVHIQTISSPAWTTDWLSEDAKQKLTAYGIAPPVEKIHSCEATESNEQLAIRCPRCSSYDTRLISRFGSTACKSLYQCNTCFEPFDYFKCH